MASSRTGFQSAFFLFSACSFWGIATVINKALLGSIPPVLLLLIQLLASTVFLWTACTLFRKSMPRGKVLLVAIALGVLNPGISYTFSLMGLERITASLSSLLWATEPFLILGLAWLILREPVTPKIVTVIVLGFTGVLFVSDIFAPQAAGRSDVVGLLFLFIAVLMCAIYTVYSRKVGVTVDALALVTVQQTAGLAWAALLFVITSGGSVTATVSAVPSSDLIYAVLTGVMYYAAAYWLYLSALNRVSAALAGGSFNIIPIVTVAVAFVFLGERLSGQQYFGAVLIIVSASALFWLTRVPSAPEQSLVQK